MHDDGTVCGMVGVRGAKRGRAGSRETGRVAVLCAEYDGIREKSRKERRTRDVRRVVEG